ncbi:MAG TPA: hypothetical protein PLP21_11640 [Pyrinomonadaceae bacterium]|nr:hypothetical protein [Acidobacteriota bacterium]HQZ96961.1 hypothetical protein [Pyrinomonadaceae bacterium]
MELFQKLGDEIETLWLEKNYNEEELPAIAAEALRRAGLPSKLTAWDVVEWSLKQRELPPQRDLHGNFADPPITIFSAPRFHIDLYFWFEGTTAIHQHGFCGAFQVLMGSSIHSWYEFETQEVINTFAEIGEMSLKVCELLEVGAVQEIIAGKRYIHALFHLEMPSATIVVRTDRSPLHLPQFAYEKPNLAIDPFFEQPTITKKLQILSAAFRAKHPEADRMATELLESSDLQTSFVILSRLRHLVGANQLEQLFKIDGAVSRFQQFLDVVNRRHGKNGEIFKPIFDRLAAIDEIVNRRSFVTNPEHRFFMALLMNVDDRSRIFSLIRQRFPDADPVEKVLDWVFDLAETRVIGVETSNALGIPNFGDAEMFVLESILNEKTNDEISAAYASENPGLDAAEAIAKVRRAAIFRPLLN